MNNLYRKLAKLIRCGLLRPLDDGAIITATTPESSLA